MEPWVEMAMIRSTDYITLLRFMLLEMGPGRLQLCFILGFGGALYMLGV